MSSSRNKLLSSRPRWTRLAQLLNYEEDKRPIFKLINYNPHAGQIPIHESRARMRIVCCGRRFGKSLAAAAEAICVALAGGGVWCVAPDYELSSIVFEEVLNFIINSDLKSQLAAEPRVGRGRQMIVCKSGGWILGKSSHKPRSLLGRGLDLVIFDEAATEGNPEVFAQYIRPTLIDRQGSFLAISTPRGDDWFRDLFDKGDPDNPGRLKAYASWQMPSKTNPHLKTSELDELTADMPEMMIRQEILAEFLENIGALFRGYRELCTIREMHDRAVAGEEYVIGVDVARSQDWMVIVVLEINTGRVVRIERFNRLDWEVQEERVVKLHEAFNAPVLIDSTGVGDRVIRALRNSIDSNMIHGFVFTNLSKHNLMRQLALSLETKELTLLHKDVKDDEGRPIGKTQLRELGSYRYEKTPSGHWKLGAANGQTDDVVTALALAREAARRFGGSMFSKAPTRPPKTEEEDPAAESSSAASSLPAPALAGTFGRPSSAGKPVAKHRRRLSGL